MVGSDANGARVKGYGARVKGHGARIKGQRRCEHNGDDAGVERWKRSSKCNSVIREVKGKEIGSPNYSRNSTPLLPRMLSQHSIISVGIVANITHVIILVIILLTVTAIHMVGGGAEVDATTRTKMTAIVTRCTMVVG